MKVTAQVLFFLLFFTSAGKALAQKNFEKAGYYEAMASNKVKVIDDEMGALEKLPSSSKGAYEGALLMKKAGLVKKAKDKLDLFKAGRKKLEAAIKAEPGNVEWRFLRLMIQENAPKAVNYRNDLGTDSLFITNNARNLSPDLRNVISNYSKNSKILNSKDF